MNVKDKDIATIVIEVTRYIIFAKTACAGALHCGAAGPVAYADHLSNFTNLCSIYLWLEPEVQVMHVDPVYGGGTKTGAAEVEVLDPE